MLGATPRGNAAVPEKADESATPLALSDYEPRSMLHVHEKIVTAGLGPVRGGRYEDEALSSHRRGFVHHYRL